MAPKYDGNGNPVGKGRGKTYGREQENRLQKRRQNLSQSAGDAFDFRTINPDKLLHMVAIMATCGGALRFGTSRDGGALAVGFYLDGGSWTEYCRPQEDIDAFLDGIIGDLLGECEARGVDI